MADSLETQLQKSFLWLERFSGDTPQLIKENLDIAQKQILELIATTQSQAKIRSEVNKIMNEAFEPLEESMLEDKDKVQELAYNATQNIMAVWTTTEAIKLNDASQAVKNRLANPNTLIQGLTLKEHLNSVNMNTTKKIQGQILDGFDKGRGIQDINREIRNTFGAVERNQLNTLTRTMLLESIRDSQNETFDYFEDEIIEYYYDATIDTRTTARCFSLNGTTSKNKEDITNLLNFHFSCRSILGVRTELSKEFDEDQKQNLVQWDSSKVEPRRTKNGLYRIGNSKSRFATPEEAKTWYRSKYGAIQTKFSVDKVKKIDIDATPEQAFKAFDKEFQIDYMGRTRYNLWASGKASFSDMVSKTRNTFIPLDQLEKKLGL